MAQLCYFIYLVFYFQYSIICFMFHCYIVYLFWKNIFNLKFEDGMPTSLQCGSLSQSDPELITPLHLPCPNLALKSLITMVISNLGSAFLLQTFSVHSWILGSSSFLHSILSLATRCHYLPIFSLISSVQFLGGRPVLILFILGLNDPSCLSCIILTTTVTQVHFKVASLLKTSTLILFLIISFLMWQLF